MAMLKSLLPPAKADFFHPAQDAPLYSASQIKHIISRNREVPPFGQRQGWLPREPADFGDGGAFPEIHIPQFPLNMGREDLAPKREVLTVKTDSQGKVNFSAIVEQGRRPGEVVFSKPSDLVTKDVADDELQRPDEDLEKETTERTRAALEQKLNLKIKAAQPAAPVDKVAPAKYIRYTPANQNNQFNSGSKHRIIRMVEVQKDPLEPPRFRARKAPPMADEAPVPVMHSPERKPTSKVREAWKIPPCISNWKNNKGYTIPLDKRLAADGRGLQEVQINPNFAKLSESLYVAECAAREEVAKRNTLEYQLALQEREENERTLKIIAERARAERVNLTDRQPDEPKEEIEFRRKRDELREERRRDREREHRLENFMGKNKSKSARDQERDISEKIALGMNVGQSQETLYDQRLFNQSQGLGSGFGPEEDYNVYSEPLFRRDDHNAIFKAPKKDEAVYGASNMDEILNTSRFKPDRDFEGIDRSQKSEPRSGPVQFEKDAEPDPYGINQFLHEAKSGKKSAPSRQNLGVMHATAGSSGSVDEYTGRDHRKRDRLEFESKGTESEKLDRDRNKERHREKNREKEERESSGHRERDRDRRDYRSDRSDRSDRHRRRNRD